jgi:hypothetical protein
MAYCRFSDADAYLFGHVNGGFECCACGLAPIGRTIFSGGYRAREVSRISKEASERGEKPPKLDFTMWDDCPHCEGKGCEECWCPNCKGKGCAKCGMHESVRMETAQEALNHLIEHRKAGHNIPEYALDRLKEEIDEKG